MKKTKFTETQTVGRCHRFALRQADTGAVVAEVCRKMGIGEATAPAARLLQLDQIAEAKKVRRLRRTSTSPIATTRTGPPERKKTSS